MTVTATREGVRADRVVVAMPETPVQAAQLSFDNGAERLDLAHGTDDLLSAEFGQPLPLVSILAIGDGLVDHTSGYDATEPPTRSR